MLRMYIAQQCFVLSDTGIEDALYDSQAIRRFVGIDLGRERAPDATTLLKLRPGKRKALSETPLGTLLERVEQAKASIRAKVEHPFHGVKNLFSQRKARYKGLSKNTAQLFSLFGFANLMLARRWLLIADSQVAS